MDWPATALGAASLVVSIVVAWRQQRLARRQEELVERSQASRVWVRFEGFDVARWPDGAPKVFADEEGRRHHSMDGWTCRVFNDSEAPIFEVSVEAIFDRGSTMLPVGELGPGSSSSIGTDEEIIVEEPMRRLRLELRFRDEAGLYWLATAMGGGADQRGGLSRVRRGLAEPDSCTPWSARTGTEPITAAPNFAPDGPA